MRAEILSAKQTKLLPLLPEAAKDFGLVGGTAIALHLGHRQSVDFDFFTNKKFSNAAVQKKILRTKTIDHVYVDQKDEYTILVGGVKLTFLFFPFKLNFTEKFGRFFKVADLLTLAALKAYALGRRAKWKDYVDLYFIFKNHFSIAKVADRARKIFGENFNEKIFRAQLSYFKEIDYSEEVNYSAGFAVSDKKIREELKRVSLS
ncbi:MAG: nucleotidyl transferase AbiEii/AbiGii toxin family protein [Patescibacteria group bacterium]|nr:nucleotidyl transferase AbiEii/AbiGii toxin family protein [Patescibacteria group bacterium]